MAFVAKTPQIQTPTQNHGRSAQSEQTEMINRPNSQPPGRSLQTIAQGNPEILP